VQKRQGSASVLSRLTTSRSVGSADRTGVSPSAGSSRASRRARVCANLPLPSPAGQSPRFPIIPTTRGRNAVWWRRALKSRARAPRPASARRDPAPLQPIDQRVEARRGSAFRWTGARCALAARDDAL